MEVKVINLGSIIFGLIVSDIFLGILKANTSYLIHLIGFKAGNSLNSLIYNKALKKSYQRDKLFSLGEITNLTQVDSVKAADIGKTMVDVISMPIEMGVICFMFFQSIGVTAFPALLFLLIILSSNYFVNMLYNIFKLKLMNAKDQRGDLVTEVFKHIRFIKDQTLEFYFIKRILIAKEKELFWLKKVVNTILVSNIINNSAPYLLLFFLVSIHFTLGHSLDSVMIYSLTPIIGLTKTMIAFIPYMLVVYSDLVVSSSRITLFLMSEEIDEQKNEIFQIEESDNDKNDNNDNELAIMIQNGYFGWDNKEIYQRYKKKKDMVYKTAKNYKFKNSKNPKKVESTSFLSTPQDGQLSTPLVNDIDPTLQETTEIENYNLKSINLEIKKGELVAIIGKSGSGKSSLLQSIAKEMYQSDSTIINTNGTMTIVNQQAWIETKSIRENILFGEIFEEEKYRKVLFASALDSDLLIMPKGDLTMLGDSGVNMSGGQKARLSLARAFYSNQEIFLIDDPLSALDNSVASQVLNEGILKYLTGRTRLVVTHSLKNLHIFDRVIIMENGIISAQGTFDDISKTQNYQALESNNENDKKQDTVESELSSPKSKNSEFEIKEDKIANSQLVETEVLPESETPFYSTEDIIGEEDREEGSISLKIILLYIKLIGGFPIFLLAILAFLFYSVMELFLTTYYFGYRSKMGDEIIKDDLIFMSIYVLLVAFTLFLMFFKYQIIFFRNIILSRFVNLEMTVNVIHSSVSNFFDTVPLGRILNRFLKDTRTIDDILPWKVTYFLTTL